MVGFLSDVDFDKGGRVKITLEAYEITVDDGGFEASIRTLGIDRVFYVSSDIGTALDLAIELVTKNRHEEKVTIDLINRSFEETAA